MSETVNPNSQYNDPSVIVTNQQITLINQANQLIANLLSYPLPDALRSTHEVSTLDRPTETLQELVRNNMDDTQANAIITDPVTGALLQACDCRYPIYISMDTRINRKLIFVQRNLMSLLVTPVAIRNLVERLTL